MKLPNFKNNIFSKYASVKKQLKVAMDGVLRPKSFYGFGDGFGSNSMVYPKFPYGTGAIQQLAYNSDSLSIIHNTLRRELFRNGYDLVESESSNEEETSSEQEEETGGKLSKHQILKKLEVMNENEQSLIDILMELEDDFSINDDIFLAFIFTYTFKKNELDKKEFSQVLRFNPNVMGLMINKYDRPGYDDENEPLYVCPIHRHEVINTEYCSCGKKCYMPYFFSDFGSEKTYYYKWEVIHRSKYRPSKRLGYSQIMANWQKVRTLIFMDKYIMELYDGQRPPKAGLFFNTSNLEGLKKTWEETKERAREEPHLPVVMGIENTGGKGDFVQFIDFMKSLDELQHTEMRNEYRKQVGAVYGVEPIFQGDNSTSGGLNNEGLQLTVTNRAIEYGQGIYNNYILPKVLEALGVQGWVLRLNPSEEQDEMARLQRQQQSLVNGQLAVSLGLDAEFDDDTSEVVIGSGSLEMPEVSTDFGGEFPAGVSSPSPSPTGAPTAKFNELLKAANQRPPFTKLADIIKNKIEGFIKKFKRKPTEAEISKEIGKINLELQSELKNSGSKLFKSTYIKAMDGVERDLGINISFGTVDENAINVLSNQKVLSKAYEGISTDLTSKLQNVITQAYHSPEGLSLKAIQDEIKDLTKVSDFKAEQISRTEMSRVSSAARKNSYQKEPDFPNFLFKWLGPSDRRTTQTSKNIKARTKNGVTYDELVKIVTEESAKEFPTWTVDKNSLVSHFSSRHSFVRVK